MGYKLIEKTTKIQISETTKLISRIQKAGGWLQWSVYFPYLCCMRDANQSNRRLPNGWWTKERIFEEAKKYSSKSDFHKAAAQAYKIALKEGWLEEMDWFPERKIKWTKETVFEASRKFTKRTAFMKYSSKAYRLAFDNGWLDDMPWIETPSYEIEWTHELVIEESKKYGSRAEFREGSRRAYRMAVQNGWLEEMSWLIPVRKKESPWTKELVISESQKYKNRSQFREGNSIAYRIAKEKGWLDEMNWFIPPRKKRSWDKESVFEESKKYKTRWDFGKNSPAYQVALRKGWINEMTWLEKHAARPLKWTKEAVIEESKKYKTRWEFGKHSPAYQVATKKGWINDMPWLLPYESQPRKWTKEAVFEEAHKYTSLTAFLQGAVSAYQKAKENGWLDEMLWLERKTPNGYWNKEHVEEEAKKYVTLPDFSKNCRVAYAVAKKEGWIKEFTWLQPYVSKPKKWTKEAVFEEASQYNTRYKFSNGSNSAYQVALKKGWLNEMDWLSNERKPIASKWTKEAVFEEARRYEYRSDFRDNSGSAYNVARKNNWLDEMDWFKVYDFRQVRKWTKEEVFNFSKQFHSRSEFQDANSRAYQVAHSNNWLEEMPWIEQLRKDKWSREEVFEESKKYSSRGQFVSSCSSAYSVALRNGWLQEMPWLGTPKKYDSHLYCVYAYEDNLSKVAYVGLTLNPEERHASHSTGLRRGVRAFSPVFNYFTNLNTPVPNPIYLETNLTATEARALEDYWFHRYEEDGYSMLNKGKTGKQSGSLGSASKTWTYQRVIEESKKYKTKTEFATNCSGAYNAARRRGWLAEMTWLEAGKVVWTKETVFKESRKYKTKKDFAKGSSGAYDCAHRNGWLPEMTWFENGRIKWTKDIIFNESRRYKTRKEFETANIQAYRYAMKMHWLDEMTWLASLRRQLWTKEEAVKESKKYDSRARFQAGCPSAYNASKRNGWIDEMEWLIPKRDIWDAKTVMEESKKYASRSEFMKGSAGAYQVAVRNHWLDDYYWLVPQVRKARKWTREIVQELAKSYFSKMDFKRAYPGAYDAAYNRGWLSEIAEQNNWVKKQ